MRFLLFWAVVALLSFLATPLLRSFDELEAIGRHEQAHGRSVLGAALPTAARSDRWEAACATTGEGRSRPSCSGYLRGLRKQAALAVQRAELLLACFQLLAPLLLAAVVDGLALRRIKRATFGSMRPAAFKLMAWVLVGMSGWPLLFLTLPLAVSPVWCLVWAGCLTLPLSLLLANSQPIFGP